MKQYKYTALNLEREKFTGTFLAKDEKDLAEQLAKQNLYLVSASIYSGKTPSAFFTTGTGKVTIAELTTFCRQFAIMINAGIPLVGCLESLKEQPYTKYFKSILEVIYEDVKSGIVLSEALNKHEKVFPDFFRNMIYVGEVAGNLDRVFTELADYYEKDTAIKKKVKSALSYPMMLGGMIIGIVILMLVFIIPTFRNALSSLNVPLSGLTKTVYDISDFMLANWLYLLAGLVVIVGGLWLFSRTKKGKECFDWLKINLPGIKSAQIDMITARFARAFSLMLSSGMDIVEALDAVKIVLGNTDVEKRFAIATDEVKHGAKLAVSFEKYNLFPTMMLQMIAVGERTASLDEILARTCDYFDEQVQTTLTSVTNKIQPAMLLIMGAVIAVMFVAVYSPMISIMQTLA